MSDTHSELSRDRIVWIDLEMSGLDIRRERILEIAVLITDNELNVVAEGPDLVIHQPQTLLDAMDEWNTEHHGASGLTKAVRESKIDEAEAERCVLEFVAAHCAECSAPLAGNSIWNDRLFLVHQMPKLEAYLHYRIIDVSTVKELGRRWHPQVAANQPEKKNSHRALDDIKESIAELTWWRSAIFRH